jgi:hypothetical protein
MRRFGFLRLAGLLLAAEALMPAQCVMCRTAMAAQAQAAGTINRAILILLLPAVALFCGVFLLAFRCPAPPGPDEEVRGDGGSAGCVDSNDAARTRD